MTTDPNPETNGDEAMFTWLEGDDAVREAAASIWDASGRLLDAQRDLEGATDAYAKAIAASGIPEQHRERLGAALILRLNRARLLAEFDDAEHPDRDNGAAQ